MVHIAALVHCCLISPILCFPLVFFSFGFGLLLLGLALGFAGLFVGFGFYNDRNVAIAFQHLIFYSARSSDRHQSCL